MNYNPPVDAPAPLIVVVAEDEALIRMLAVDELIDAGFEIIEAAHAAEALAILNSRADGIHVLFSDIHMPGTMNGLELAHYVRTQWPWIALLLTSGRACPTMDDMPADCRFIPKPYELHQVIHHLRDIAPV